MIAEVHPRPPETIFIRIGNAFAWSVGLAAIALLVAAHRRRLASPPGLAA